MIDYTTHKMGENGDILVVAVGGHLDSESSVFFFDCITGMIEDGAKKLVIDCRDVEYMSSMGLGMLVRAHSRMKKIGGNVKLARVEGLVADVLSTTGLNRLFHLYPTVRDACASFES